MSIIRRVLFLLAIVAMLAVPFTASATQTLLVGKNDTGSPLDFHDGNVPGTAEAFKFTAAASGNVERLRFFYDTYPDLEPGGSIKLGLYSDSSGNPGTLMASCTVSSANSTKGWNECTVSSTAVTASTTYWLAVLGPVGETYTYLFADDSGPSNSASVHDTQSLSDLPSTWSTGTFYQNSPAAIAATTAP